MDLDAILNNAADTVLEPSPVKDVVDKPKPAPVPAEIKPWLASSANVPKDIREKWTKYVKSDLNAKVLSKLQPSHSYSSWDSTPIQTSKLLGDLVRKSATAIGFDEPKTAKLVSLYQPVTDTEFSKKIQVAFAECLLTQQREIILSDPNYNQEKYPNLARILSSK